MKQAINRNHAFMWECDVNRDVNQWLPWFVSSWKGRNQWQQIGFKLPKG